MRRFLRLQLAALILGAATLVLGAPAAEAISRAETLEIGTAAGLMIGVFIKMMGWA